MAEHNKENIKENEQYLLNEIGLENDVIDKIVELQGLIFNKRGKKLSLEEMIQFLNSAMNYDEAQIWLLRNKIGGIEVSTNDMFKKLLSVTSNDDMLTIYDIEQNYDEKNLKNVREAIEQEAIQKKKM